jgi:hypothetical protein
VLKQAVELMHLMSHIQQQSEGSEKPKQHHFQQKKRKLECFDTVKIQGSLRRILESIYKKGEKMDAQ